MEHAIVFLDRESVGADVRKANFPHTYTEHQSTWTPEDIVGIEKMPVRFTPSRPEGSIPGRRSSGTTKLGARRYEI